MKVELFQNFAVRIQRSIKNAAAELEKNFPTPSTVEYHMPKKYRKVVKDHGVTIANGYPK
jgi:hypothetical protein